MSDSPTPQEESKGDNTHLPEIDNRSDTKAEVRQEEEKKEETKTHEPTKTSEPAAPVDDHKTEYRDTRTADTNQQSETNDDPSNTPSRKGDAPPPQQKISTSSRETTESDRSRANQREDDSSHKKGATKTSETGNTTKKSGDSEEKREEKSSERKEEQKETKSDVKTKGNKKEGSDNQNTKGSKPETKSGDESPRKKEEGESKGGKKKGDQEESENRKSKDQKERSGELTNRSERSETGGEFSEGRSRQKEFFKMELTRLESSLKRESSKIIEPSKKPHTPFIFNTLEPYYNTRMTRFLIELPDEMKHGHTSRRTAQGLTDPWLDLKMDRDILPKVASKPVSRQVAILKKEREIRDRKKRSAMNASSTSRKEGSTRLPKFPMVQLETQDMASKQLYYSDVPTLRHELKTKYSSSAKTKIDEDYKRTHADFYRMELDKLDEVHPINRSHMKSAYFAYLQNTPGSKKAITECVRGLKSGKAQ